MAVIPIVVAVVAIIGYTAAGNEREDLPTRVKHLWGALALLGIWMVAAGAIASSGIFQQFQKRPPPLLWLMLAVLAVSALIGLSAAGARLAEGLTFSALVGFQAFRFPLEIVMHQAAREGVMPKQMTFTGMNFDILTGISAIALSAMIRRGRASRALIGLWNTIGLVLLVTVSLVGLLSTPMFHVFGQEPARLNTFIAEFPFVWLPAVMVVAALVGHIVIFRKLA